MLKIYFTFRLGSFVYNSNYIILINLKKFNVFKLNETGGGAFEALPPLFFATQFFVEENVLLRFNLHDLVTRFNLHGLVTGFNLHGLASGFNLHMV